MKIPTPILEKFINSFDEELERMDKLKLKIKSYLNRGEKKSRHFYVLDHIILEIKSNKKMLKIIKANKKMLENEKERLMSMS